MASPATAASPAADATNGRILGTGTAVTSGMRLCGPLHHTVGPAVRVTPDVQLAEPGRTGCTRREERAPFGRGPMGGSPLLCLSGRRLDAAEGRAPPNEGHPWPIPRR